MRDLSPIYPGNPGFPEAIMPEQDSRSCFFSKRLQDRNRGIMTEAGENRKNRGR